MNPTRLSVWMLVVGVVGGFALLPMAAAQGPAQPQQASATGPARSGHDRSIIGDRDCSECHTPEGWALSELSGSSGGFDHARTGFPLTGTHAAVACIDCHLPEQQINRQCSSCHRDDHRGRFGLQCDQCHSARTWRDTRASRRHRLTRLPLTGMHALLDCSSCHIRSADRAWDGVSADCFACHEDDYRRDIHPVHQGDPDDPNLQLFPRNCGECHRPIAWSPAFVNPDTLQSALRQTRTRQRHDIRFPISFGKHRGAPCASCHRSRTTPQLVDCTGCHAHSLPQLRQRHNGRSVATDGTSCLRCHPGGAAK